MKKGDIQSIPMKQIAGNGRQPRQQFVDATIRELAASIKEYGLLQPIIVRPAPGRSDFYQVIVGARRFRAAQLAGLEEIPAFITSLDDLKSYEVALIENVQREDLTVFEEALAIFHIMKNGGYQTADDLARQIGKSSNFIRNRLKLLQLPEAVQKRIAQQEINVGQATMIANLKDPERQKLIAELIADNKLTNDETQALILKKIVKLERKLKIGQTLSPLLVLERLHALLDILRESMWPAMGDESKNLAAGIFNDLGSGFKKVCIQIQQTDAKSPILAAEMAKQMTEELRRDYLALHLLLHIEETERRVRNLNLPDYDPKYHKSIKNSLNHLAKVMALRLNRLSKKPRSKR